MNDKHRLAAEIDPALRRAFMRVNPDYFTWPIEEQERYRVAMPEKDALLIRRELLKGLFNIEAKTAEEMETALDAFGDEKYLAFNSVLLPAMGVGEDYFFLNEFLDGGKTVLDFTTLYDYDYDDHCFQERARREATPEYAEKPYRGSLFHGWARLLVDGKFHYASLSMAAGYVYSEMEELGDEKLAALIPHRYVEGRDHGKREGKGMIFDHRIDAGGVEAQVEELQRRMFRYLAERYEALLTEFDGAARKAVYMKDKSGKNDPHINFVLSDKTALQAVRFRHFLGGCRGLLADRAELDAFVKRERQAMGEYMDSACRDILANFDTKVVRFRKKRKVIVAEGAVKGLF
jgi:hypothetical protein